jgi:Ni,Fe-hydrogenase III large subunit
MTALSDLLATGALVTDHRPWPRAWMEPSGWEAAIGLLVDGRLTLLSLWGEPGVANMALYDGAARQAGVISLLCPDGWYPSVGVRHAPAIRLERTMRDLFGLEPQGLHDIRPWLDHGRWGDTLRAATDYAFLPSHGSALHQIPVGPVHAGIIEPGHFRFTCDGETVVRLEERLGYVHKGIDKLMSGATLERAAALAARLSGDSTVAYSLAFAHAVEAALGATAPRRAVWLRAVMAELERIANHVGDFGAICNDASFGIMLAHCAVLREKVLRACAECFGHRLMMDRIVPGGVAADLDAAGLRTIRRLLVDVRATISSLTLLYDGTASLQDRTVTTGTLRPDLARRFAPGGFVGRASGRDFDARRDLPYAPYDELDFAVPVLTEGDVNARIWIRLKEIDQSLLLLDQLMTTLPDGEIRTPLSVGADPVEGVAVAESFRGDVLVWLRVSGGVIDRCHLRDASWFQWPLLEAVIEGNIVADFPLCNKSFNCSYSGHDL